MKVRITRNTFIRGEPVSAGKIVEVDDSTFRQLKAANKAEAYGEPAPEVAEKKPAKKKPQVRKVK